MAPKSTRGVTTAVGAVAVIVLFFAYSRRATHAAKRDATRHRAADGGQISWRNESLRRHGVMERPESPNVLGALFPSTSKQDDNTNRLGRTSTAEEEKLQAAKGKRKSTED